MLADRHASNVRLSSVFAREFCPLCVEAGGPAREPSTTVDDDESARERRAAQRDIWRCPKCRGPVENAEDIICLPCLNAYSFRSFAAE